MSAAESSLSLSAALGELFPSEVLVRVDAIDAAAHFAFPEEHACVAAAVDKRQREFSTGRRLAHLSLRELGVAPAPLLPAKNRAPVWPSGVVGTISHSRAWCVVAVVPSAEFLGLGVDHEPATPLQTRLWRNVLLPVEQKRMASLSEAEQALHAKLIFSAKECLYKAAAAQLGELIGFRDVELHFDVDAKSFRGEILDPQRAARVTGALQGRYLLRAEGIFTAMTLRAAN